MKQSYRILVINPKMYSTDIAVFHDEIFIYKETFDLDPVYQADYKYSDREVKVRKAKIVETLFETNISLSKIDAVCARGGLLRLIEGGTQWNCYYW